MIAIPALPRAPAVPRWRGAPIVGALLLAVVGALSTAERPLHPAPLVRATIALDGAGGADAVVGDWALGHVAVGDSLDGAVRLLDDRDGRLLDAITVGAAFASQALAVDTRYHRLYVADQAADGSGSRLWTLDARTGAPLHVARLSGVVASIGVVEGAGRAIVTNEENNRVAILDARTGHVLRAVRAGLAPLAVAVDERRARAYVVDGGAYIAGYPAGSGAVNLLDTRTGRVLRTVSVGAEPSAIAVDDQAGLVVVANRGEGTVSVLDARDGALRGTVRVGGQPAGVVVDEQRGRAFVIDALDDTVRVLDLRHQTTTRTAHVGGRPHAIAIDSARGLVLVAADGPLDGGGRPLGPGVVDLLDAGSGAMVRAVVVGVAPRAIAVDSRRGRAIIVNSGGVTRPSWLGDSVGVTSAAMAALVARVAAHDDGLCAGERHHPRPPGRAVGPPAGWPPRGEHSGSPAQSHARRLLRPAWLRPAVLTRVDRPHPARGWRNPFISFSER